MDPACRRWLPLPDDELVVCDGTGDSCCVACPAPLAGLSEAVLDPADVPLPPPSGREIVAVDDVPAVDKDLGRISAEPEGKGKEENGTG